jgi:hypothetical protein
MGKVQADFKKIMKRGITIILLLLALSHGVSAAPITVNPGQSIQSAVNSAIPGDTVTVMSGTYNERVTVSKDGRSGAKITVKASGHVKMKGFKITGDYVRIEGFEVTDTGEIGIDIREVRGVEIIDNNVHHVGKFGIYAEGDDFIIQGNDVSYMMSGDGDCLRIFGDSHLVQGNKFHHTSKKYASPRCHCDGIQHYDMDNHIRRQLTNAVFEDNILYEIDGQCFISESKPDRSHDNVWRRNVCHQGSDPDWQMLNIKDGDNWVIENNVFWGESGNAAIKLSERHVMKNVRIANNIVKPGIRLWSKVHDVDLFLSHNLEDVDPLFVNPGPPNYDFNVKPGSPACGAAENGGDVGVYACD